MVTHKQHQCKILFKNFVKTHSFGWPFVASVSYFTMAIAIYFVRFFGKIAQVNGIFAHVFMLRVTSKDRLLSIWCVRGGISTAAAAAALNQSNQWSSKWRMNNKFSIAVFRFSWKVLRQSDKFTSFKLKILQLSVSGRAMESVCVVFFCSFISK